MDVDDHDAAVARVSHLPHLMSVLMAGHLTAVPTAAPAAGRAGSARRHPDRRQRPGAVGADPRRQRRPRCWRSSARVRAQLAGLIARCRDRHRPTGGAARTQLTRGVDGTRRIPGKHGAAPATYSQVVVAIPDAPGALARLFADVGAAGVNVEDIAIEHDQVRQIGYLALSVDARAGGRPDSPRCGPGGWSTSGPEPPGADSGGRCQRLPVRWPACQRQRESRSAHRRALRERLVVAIDGPSGSGKSQHRAWGRRPSRPGLPRHRGDVPRGHLARRARRASTVADTDRRGRPGPRRSSSTSPSTRPAPRSRSTARRHRGHPRARGLRRGQRRRHQPRRPRRPRRPPARASSPTRPARHRRRGPRHHHRRGARRPRPGPAGRRPGRPGRASARRARRPPSTPPPSPTRSSAATADDSTVAQFQRRRARGHRRRLDPPRPGRGHRGDLRAASRPDRAGADATSRDRRASAPDLPHIDELPPDQGVGAAARCGRWSRLVLSTLVAGPGARRRARAAPRPGRSWPPTTSASSTARPWSRSPGG